jgi:fimbrial chaperone protein
MQRAIKGRAAIVAALSYIIYAVAANAASVNVVPVRVNINPTERSSVVTIRNTGPEDLSMQADGVAWTQDEAGEDVYAESDDLLVVPRIFTVPAGGSQLVRIGQIVPAAAPVETAYRVFFTELAAEETGRTSPGLRIRLRLGIPVFIAPAGSPEPALQLVRSGRTDEGYEVVLRNSGNLHVQLTGLEARTQFGDLAETVATDAAVYLLPGTARRIEIPIARGARVSSISAVTDTAGTVEYVLPFGD